MPRQVITVKASYSADDVLLWGMALLALALSWLLWDVAVTIDNQTLLYNTMRMMQGGLYTRWFEVDPPLIFLLYTAPVTLIVQFHMAPNHALYLFAWTLCLWSLWTIRRSLQRSALESAVQKRVLAASICMLLIISLIYDGFADREHLLFALSLPWIVQMLFGLPRGAGSILAAAVGFCIKPYNFIIPFMLIILGGEPGMPWRQRIISPSVIGIAAVTLLYALVVYTVFPGYLFNMVPLALTAYNYISTAPTMKIFYACVYAVFIAIPAVYALSARGWNRKAWIGFVLSVIICYFFNSGWPYTHYLLAAPPVFVLLSAFPFGERLAENKESGWRHNAKTLLLWAQILIMAGFAYVSIATVWNDRERSREAGIPYHVPRSTHRQVVEDLAPYMSSPFISVSLAFWSSSVTDITLPLRQLYGYDFVWALPWLMHNPHAENSDRVRHMITDPLLLAMREDPQAYVIITSTPPRDGVDTGDTDYMPLLRSYPDVDAALSHYVKIKTLNECTEKIHGSCLFSIWKRAQ